MIYRILGFVLILWGIRICFDPIQYSSKFGVTFDYTGINLPFGLFLAALGSYFVWSTFRKNKRK